MSDFQIPDSVSFDTLTQAMENAPSEDIMSTMEPGGLFEAASEYVLAAKEISDNTAVFHKAMVINILHRMVEWHTQVAELHTERGDIESARSWMRDAGKFQAILTILVSIQIDPEEDFMVAN